MNARQLQIDVAEDLTRLFQPRRFKTPKDEASGEAQQAQITFYLQNLPRMKNEDEVDPFPYGIVRISGGGIETRADPYKVNIMVLIGIFDDDLANQGHNAVTECMELIQEHYEENPVLKGRFKYVPPCSWALQDEESFPFFFGAVNLVFEVPRPATKARDLV